MKKCLNCGKRFDYGPRRIYCNAKCGAKYRADLKRAKNAATDLLAFLATHEADPTMLLTLDELRHRISSMILTQTYINFD